MTPYQYAVDLRKQADLKVASEFEVLRQAHKEDCILNPESVWQAALDRQ